MIGSSLAGGGSFECNDAACKSPAFLKAVAEYQEEKAKFLSALESFAAQRPLTNKHQEAISTLIATYTDILMPKFVKIKFARNDCNGKLCFDGAEEAETNLKNWDCDLTDMLTEAIVNKDI